MNQTSSDAAFGPALRRVTSPVRVGRGAGAVTVGGGAAIVVQSMTNTDTADVEATPPLRARLRERHKRGGSCVAKRMRLERRRLLKSIDLPSIRRPRSEVAHSANL